MAAEAGGRTIISYDDITLPYSQPDPSPSRPSGSTPSGPSQSKKRKWSNRKSGQSQANKNNKAANGSSNPVEKEADGDEDEDADSRYLTQEEIWDDSALIDAWNAATEEYEAMNGPDKGWKNEPVHKSPLWYNIPPTKPPPKKQKTTAAANSGPSGANANETDSQPLDFDTFVPDHDASLALPDLPYPDGAPDMGFDYSAAAHPPPGLSVATQDEAFARALGAMYWGGYWTAVYHCHRSAAQTSAASGVGESGTAEDEMEAADDAGENEDVDEDDEGFVSTQR
ncbi:hypothetical protein R3P38DRAFT_1853236 [Favolaschia claudopus]|uniref:Survival Motor Neuron Gemin2-binding domain-containing protein n=1 Tax=Favolaschia claudopus TaxID=2862362 RepID=A0AAW0D963_9AGAR